MRPIRAARLATTACVPVVLGMAVMLSAPQGIATPRIAAAKSPPAAPGWTTSLAPAPTRPNGTLASMRCPTPHWCMALGTHIRPDGLRLPGAVMFNGKTWQRKSVPAPAPTTSSALAAADCSGPTHCLAIYYVSTGTNTRPLVESWNGHRWHANTHVPWAPKKNVHAVVCADAGHCLVSFEKPNAYVQTRTGWQRVQVPVRNGSAGFSGVWAGSCGAKDDCILAEPANRRLAVVHWNGRQFGHVSITAVHVHNQLDIGGVSCWAPHACVFTGANAARTTTPVLARWDGTRWKRVTLPRWVPGELDGGSCTPGGDCYFTGTAPPTGEYGKYSPYLLSHVGKKWTYRDRDVYDLDCGAAFCAASVLGNGGWSIMQRDGGSWHNAQVPNPTGYQPTWYSAISCTSSTCMAAGVTNRQRGVVFAHLTPTGWRLQQQDDLGGYHGQLHTVSCDAPDDCWAGGEIPSQSDPLLYHYDGSNWQRVAVSSGGTRLWAIAGISCVSTTFCMAVGGDGSGMSTDRWNGSTWTIQDVGQGFAPSDVSCTSPTFCMAVRGVGSGGGSMRWDGSTWHYIPGSGLDRVSCVSSTFCMATGQQLSSSDPDTIAVWNGSSWSSRSYPHPGSPWSLNAVSCVAVNSCTVAGLVSTDSRPYSRGFSETLSGGSWHVHIAAARGEFDQFNAIACPSAMTCRAVGTFRVVAPLDSEYHIVLPTVAELQQ